MKKALYIFAIFTAALFAMAGCNQKDQPFDGADKSLTSFCVTSNGVQYQGAILGDRIILSAPYGVDLSSAKVEFELCEQATITPDPSKIVDWNSDHVFRVKSYSTTAREYTYSVRRTEVAQTGNVQLLTQTDVDNFAKLGATIIDGNLIIGSDSKPVEDSIVDLESLASVKEVRYNIIVNRSFAGGTLKGLENIERCGALHIGTIAAQIEFPALSGLSIDMPKLRSAGDVVLNSSSIKSLVFEKLESVASLYIASNSLVALKLSMLKESVGNLNLNNSSASINSILPKISFPSLEKVGGLLSIQWFSGVDAVDFTRLSYVGGDINLALSSGLLEEVTLPELTSLTGSIIVERAPAILKFSIPKITQVKSLTYNKSSNGSYPLEQLDLPSLHTIIDELYLRDLAMETLEIANLKEVGGNVVFWDLKLVADISLPAIKKIGKNLQFYRVTMLETFDLSTLDTLTKFEAIGCLKLAKVKLPSAIGDLTINYASDGECITPIFEGLERIDGTLYFSNDYSTSLYDIKNIKTINILKFGGGKVGAVLNLFDVEKINAFELSSSNLVTLNAPKLKEVTDLKFSYVSALTTLTIPMLKTVGTFSLSEHSSWSTSSAKMTNINAYSGITSIDSVNVSLCNKLVDFSGLSQVISTLDPAKWSVSSCGYNPTYQNMVDGNYVGSRP